MTEDEIRQIVRDVIREELEICLNVTDIGTDELPQPVLRVRSQLRTMYGLEDVCDDFVDLPDLQP